MPQFLGKSKELPMRESQLFMFPACILVRRTYTEGIHERSVVVPVCDGSRMMMFY
jgi:hypothetical protein